MTTRRNILTILGLTAAASGAIAADDVTDQRDMSEYPPSSPMRLQLENYDPERFAVALERLAAEVRAKTILVAKLNIGADVVNDNRETDWLRQTITIGTEVLI